MPVETEISWGCAEGCGMMEEKEDEEVDEEKVAPDGDFVMKPLGDRELVFVIDRP